MADTPYPIPASLRQEAVFVGNGSTTYGPFGDGWGIFDVTDVMVETRAAVPGTDPWIETAVTVAKTDPTAAYSEFTITFAAAQTSATQIRVTGDRVPRRELAISKGQALDVVQLERELSAFCVNLQELRRTLKAVPAIIAGDAASQAAASAAAAAAALLAIQALGVDPTGYLSKAGNLAGLASQATARTNLGLGSAAVQSAGAFAAAVHTHPASGVTGGIKGFSRNLKYSNDAVSPNSKINVTADELVLKDGSGIGLLLTGVNVPITMGAAGLGSLDTGTEAASTWYYIWIVSDGANVNGVYSTSSVDCATLGAYTYKALVGAVYNDGSSNFRMTWGQGRRIWQAPAIVLNGVAGVTSITSIDLSVGAPPIAIEVAGRHYLTANNTNNMKLYTDAAGVGPQVNVVGSFFNAPVDGEFPGQAFELPILTPQTLWRKHNALTGSVVLNIQGFTLSQRAT